MFSAKNRKFALAIIIVLFSASCELKNMPENKIIRYPAVAGQFYEDDQELLKKEIDNYLAKVDISGSTEEIKGIIVPHAGYYYSAGVAASAYKSLQGRSIKNVILIGNSHSQYFSGIAIDDSDVWQTPLGEIEVNKKLARDVADYDDSIIKINKEPHIEDHILEVQLPFLQTVLKPEFKIVPIVFGNAEADNYLTLAQSLQKNIGMDDLIVISTDMSHYPSYEEANDIDNKTIEKILEGDIGELEKHIREIKNRNVAGEETLLCGSDSVKTIMELADNMGWTTEKLDYKNSGDISGDKGRVVGYGAVVYTTSEKLKVESYKVAEKNNFTNEQKNILLQIAKETVESFVGDGVIPEFNITDERLLQKQGAFVTLHQNGQLRGCIGQIIPTSQDLWEVVRDMAIEAATEDPRFYPVSKDDLNQLKYEISVLSVPEKIDDWKKIELGKHGVIVRQGNRAGVFLPQVVTETGWSREELLSQLCSQKAGLDPKCYLDPNVEIKIFTAEVF